MEGGAIATAPSLPPILEGNERTYTIELSPIPEIQDAEWTVQDADGHYVSAFSKTVKKDATDPTGGGTGECVTVYSA